MFLAKKQSIILAFSLVGFWFSGKMMEVYLHWPRFNFLIYLGIP
jgi:hypothetical protein